MDVDDARRAAREDYEHFLSWLAFDQPSGMHRVDANTTVKAAAVLALTAAIHSYEGGK